MMDAIILSDDLLRASGITSGGEPVTLARLGRQAPEASPEEPYRPGIVQQARKSRVARYARLRDSGLTPAEAAAEIGLGARTARDYERAYEAAR